MANQETVKLNALCRETDNYVNVTMLCQTGGKLFKNWRKAKATQSFLELLSDELGAPEAKLLVYESGSNATRRTWAHPRVALHIAQWISSDFAVKVSGWIEEWKAANPANLTRCNDAMREIKPDSTSQCERKISDRLSRELSGQREVETCFGLADVVTESAVIEVKEATRWKHGLGQILAYADNWPDKTRRLHLFGEVTDLERIRELCAKFNVEVTVESE